MRNKPRPGVRNRPRRRGLRRTTTPAAASARGPLPRLAASQHGHVTTGQLQRSASIVSGATGDSRSAAFTESTGAFTSLAGPDSPPLGEEHAAVLACGAGAVLSHRSAAWLLHLIREHPNVIDVSVPRGRTPSHPGIRVHRVRDLPRASSIRTIEGIPMTNALRTLSIWPPSLPRTHDALHPPRERGSRYRAKHCTAVWSRPAQLLRARDRSRWPPRTPPPSPPLRSPKRHRLARGPRRSAGLLRLIRSACLPQPEANILLGTYEVDLLWRDQRLIVEVDGFEFHGSRRSFEADRLRDARLQAAGWRVMRVTWRQLVETPAAVVANLAAALAVSPAI